MQTENRSPVKLTSPTIFFLVVTVLFAQPCLAAFVSPLAPIRKLNDTVDGVGFCAIGHPTLDANCADPDGAGPLVKGDGHQWTGNVREIVFDSQGNYYISDSAHYEVRKFDSSDTMLLKLTTNSGGFRDVWGVAVDSQDNVYVSTFRDNGIEKFDSAGNRIPSGDISTGNRPAKIHIDAQDNLYVVLTLSNPGSVQRYDSNGALTLTISSINAVDVATDSAGNIYMTLTDSTGTLRKYSSAGQLLAVQAPGAPADITSGSVVVDSLDQVWIANPRRREIVVYDANLNELFSFGSSVNPADVLLSRIGQIAFNPSESELYIGEYDFTDMRISVWGASGDPELLRIFCIPTCEPFGWFGCDHIVIRCYIVPASIIIIPIIIIWWFWFYRRRQRP